MKIISTKITTGILCIFFFVVTFLSLSSSVQAGVPTDPPQPTRGSIQFNIVKEAVLQELPTATTFGTSSDVFKQQFANLIGSVLSIVITIGVLMLLLYLVWGAFSWITSGGDKGKVEEARNRMTTAVIGIIVLSSSVAIFMLVQQILGICVLDFWGTACRTPAVPRP